MDNRTSSSSSLSVRDATSDARNDYRRVVEAMCDTNDNHVRYGRAALVEFTYPIADKQTPLPVPTNPAPFLPFSQQSVDRLMYSLDRTDISSLADKDKLCEICFLSFDEWRWKDGQTTNAGDSDPFKVLCPRIQ